MARGMSSNGQPFPSPSYMDGTMADLIIHRMILGLLPEPAATQTTVATAENNHHQPRKSTVVVTQAVSSDNDRQPHAARWRSGTTGEVMVYSSPTGASILIDGIYWEQPREK